MNYIFIVIINTTFNHVVILFNQAISLGNASLIRPIKLRKRKKKNTVSVFTLINQLMMIANKNIYFHISVLLLL